MTSQTPPPSVSDPAVLALVAQALSGLSYGQVVVTVHESRVVEVCTITRRRFPKT